MRHEAQFETGLDYSRPDELTDAEREALVHWYGTIHGTDVADLRLVPFVPFLAEHLPGALKRWRRFAEAVGSDSAQLPHHMVALLFLHLYIVMGHEDGIHYEVIAARTWGATRQEVLDTINLAFLYAGPFGISAAARATDGLLTDWEVPGRDTASLAWVSRTSEDGDDTSRSVESNVPLNARARRWLGHPGVAAHRDRVDSAASALPRQAASLFLIHLGVARANAAMCEHAARDARLANVSPAVFEEAALWGLAYGGEVGLELATRTINTLTA